LYFGLPQQQYKGFYGLASPLPEDSMPVPGQLLLELFAERCRLDARHSLPVKQQNQNQKPSGYLQTEHEG
jgi:hypothetical protein